VSKKIRSLRSHCLAIGVVALSLVALSACSSSSKNTANPADVPPTTRPDAASSTTVAGSGSPPSTIAPAATGRVDLTATGRVTFHITGTKLRCATREIQLLGTDYPVIGKMFSVNILSAPNPPEVQWSYTTRLNFDSQSSGRLRSSEGIRVRTSPLKVLFSHYVLSSPLRLGAPRPAPVTLEGAITCPR
jgi:hypothetical protein